MNTPSTLGGNWCWRAEPGFATEELAARVRRQMALYHRLPARVGDARARDEKTDRTEETEEA